MLPAILFYPDEIRLRSRISCRRTPANRIRLPTCGLLLVGKWSPLSHTCVFRSPDLRTHIIIAICPNVKHTNPPSACEPATTSSGPGPEPTFSTAAHRRSGRLGAGRRLTIARRSECSLSGRHQDRMIRFLGRVGEGGAYVFGLQIRVVGENVRLADPGCQQIEDILDADAHAADARSSAALLGIEGDPLHGMKLPIRWAAVKRGHRVSQRSWIS
jgi:hypothetical protein